MQETFYRREERKKIPPDQQKPPGRKSGHPGSYRKQTDQIDQTIEVPLVHCPHCCGPLTGIERLEQIIEEIPAVRRPRSFRP